MARLFTKKFRGVGLPPGSLIPSTGSTARPPLKARLALLEYTADSFTEKSNAPLDECAAYLNSDSMTWIQVYGVNDPTTISLIGQRFHLHPLVLEDIMVTGQRSKLDVYGDQIFIIFRLLRLDIHTEKVRDEQVSLVFGPNYLISFQEHDEEIFTAVKERLRQKHQRLHKEKADYLAYTLLDTIVDYSFIVLESMDIRLDQLEGEMTQQAPTQAMIAKIQHMKREMIIIRKAVWPARDIINRLVHLDHPLLTASTQVYLRDIYDHIIQTIDIIEGFRDVLASMLDLYISSINIRTNEIMKVLTIVSTIFVPLTFISSLYGMNVEMPEAHLHYIYPFILGLMAISAASMLAYFRHKQWL